MIPDDVTRDDVVAAMTRFDEEHRGQGRYDEWESDGRFKYAIEHQGKLYPPKQIISLAAGIDRQMFSGGEEANSFLRSRGFTISRLSDGSSLERDSEASSDKNDTVQPDEDLEAIVRQFSEELRSSHLIFGTNHEEVVRNFVVSLATKRFVILTGLSGSGKTQIAKQFGRWLGEDRYKVVPVRPDWTGSEALFGFPDALQPSKDSRHAWHVPGPLEFMLDAAGDPQHPYLMILDEMNLAHVERYFADVISGMESDEPCLPNLTEDDDGLWRKKPGKPDRIKLPENLFIAGTVNVDETTYMFSPKILDRANTIEFRVRAEDLRSDLRRPDNCARGDRALVQGFMSIAQNEDWHFQHTVDRREELVDYLRDLHRTLDHGFAFGHRVVYEALRFSALHHAAGGSGLLQALDIQIMQKILPRLHGARRRLEPVLCAVGKFCFDLTSTNADTFDPAEQNAAEAQLPRSFAKLQEMLERLRVNQFVSFTE